jgi:serine/threonine-protein kinase
MTHGPTLLISRPPVSWYNRGRKADTGAPAHRERDRGARRLRGPTMSNVDRVTALLLRWDELRAQGQAPSAEDLCRDCPELLPEVRQRVEARAALFQGTSAVPTVGPVPPPAAGPAAHSGGRFRPLRFHAKGGLGEVHVALDAELNREIALKQMQERFADDGESRRRFLMEAEVTGRLEHPGVVPVYGLGADANGRPYYAMRFIKGDSLADAIDRFHHANYQPRDRRERALKLRGLLSRFVGVCNAVAYAHSRGIVHRDIKPANVLLGPFGETLLVDWGLAKVVHRSADRAAGEDTLTPLGSAPSSGTLGAVGTPAYMSPEQASGRSGAVGPPSDVYGLGATLYALVTGQAPFADEHLDELLVKVACGEVVPPRQRNPSVPRALEAVCLKAMALKREERYASALDLAADVERWLADEPVSADREPWRERLARWGRRHRTVVSAGVVLLLVSAVALAVGLAAVRAEQAETKRQRDSATTNWELAEGHREKAEANLKRAEANGKEAEANLKLAQANLKLAKQAVDDCYVLATKEPLLQQESTKEVRKLLLKKALPFYKGFRAQRPDDPALQDEHAEQLFRVAFITDEIGNKADALNSFEEARKLLVKLVADRPNVPLYQTNLAGTYNNLGVILRDLGKRAAAARKFEEARKIQAQLVKDRPNVLDYQLTLAGTYHNLGILQSDLGERELAAKNYEQARKIQAQLVADRPDVPLYQYALGRTYHNLGLLQSDLGERAAAAKSYDEARKLLVKLVADHPDVGEYQHDLARTYNHLGILQRHLDERAAAVKSFEEARKLRAQLVAAQPNVPAYQNALAATYTNLGNLQREAGERALAAKSYEAARKILVKLVADRPNVPEYQRDLAATYTNLGILQRELGEPGPAVKNYQEARNILVKLVAAQPNVPRYQQDLGRTYTYLGLLQSELGERGPAAKSYEEARKIQDRLVSKHGDFTDYRIELARTCFHQGALFHTGKALKEARQHYSRAIDLLQPLHRRLPKHPTIQAYLPLAHRNRAVVLQSLDQHLEAVPDWDQAIQLSTAAKRPALMAQRGYALARGADHVRARAAAEALVRLAPSANLIYDAACMHALCCGVVATDVSLPAAEREWRQEAHALRSLALLARARAAGFFTTANVETLQKDPDLDVLRQRDDFQEFLTEVLAKAKAKKPGPPPPKN